MARLKFNFNPEKKLKELLTTKGSLNVLLKDLERIESKEFDCIFDKLEEIVRSVVNFQKKEWELYKKILDNYSDSDKIISILLSIKKDILFLGLESLKLERDKSDLKVEVENKELVSKVNIRFTNHYSSDDSEFFTNPLSHIVLIKTSDSFILKKTFEDARDNASNIIGTNVKHLINNIKELKKIIWRRAPIFTGVFCYRNIWIWQDYIL